MVETDATEGFQQRSEVIFRSDFRSRDCMLGFDLGLSQNPGGSFRKFENSYPGLSKTSKIIKIERMSSENHQFPEILFFEKKVRWKWI